MAMPNLKEDIQNEENIIVLDTETTGLSEYDEILELAIVDGYGQTLFNHRFKPKRNTEWKEAEAVHGISFADVENLPTIDNYKDKIKAILNDKIIVGYNVNFDCGFLREEKLFDKNYFTVDIMGTFAEIYGEWNDYWGDYTFQKLTTCADYYDYKWEGTAHGALADTKATLFCFKKILNTPDNNLKLSEHHIKE